MADLDGAPDATAIAPQAAPVLVNGESLYGISSRFGLYDISLGFGDPEGLVDSLGTRGQYIMSLRALLLGCCGIGQYLFFLQVLSIRSFGLCSRVYRFEWRRLDV